MKNNWLTVDFKGEFQDLERRTYNPFDILDDLSTLEKLCEFLCSGANSNGQLSLLWTDRELIDLLHEMRSAQEQRIPLYHRFSIQTNGKVRELTVPKDLLRDFLNHYLLGFVKSQSPHPIAHGGEKRWSTKSSLKTHLPIGTVLSFDIAGAFENTNFNYIFGFFYHVLEGNDLDSEERRDTAGFLARMSTVKYQNGRGLPQGAPHSVALFNRLLYPLDSLLAQRALERGFTVTRWLDDLTISSPGYQELGDMLGAVALVSEVFPIARGKVFYQTADKPIYLLGQRIDQGTLISHNSPEDREANKGKPVNYRKWFGENRSKKYEDW